MNSSTHLLVSTMVFTLSLFALNMSPAQGNAGPDASSATPEQLDIIAYCTPPIDQMSVERFREMVECGFTAGIPAERIYDMESTDKMLRMAHEAGLKLFVNVDETLTEPERVAEYFRGNPGLAGYFVIDEPTWGPEGWSKTHFVAKPIHNVSLGDIVSRLQSVEPEHPAYINLFPNFASPEQLGTSSYEEHVNRLIEEVPDLRMLSFDHYPIANYRVSEYWYQNLETISAAARKRGIPFWAFALTSTHYSYTPATLDHLRLQMHVNLAYGAQGLQYFPYWAPNRDHWYSPINVDGTRGELFEHVKTMNAEVQTMAPVFKNATVLEVSHTGSKAQWRPGSVDNPQPWVQEEGPLPPGTRPYVPAAPFTEVVTQGSQGAVISNLEKNGRRFQVVVNKDYAHAMVLQVHFDGSRQVQIMTECGQWEPIEETYFHQIMPPSGIRIFSWESAP
ncbi:hypothetical protein ACERK3_14695 [Phycisphaerales bacterium AB-hyl4]|uniref:Glycoside hydrolase family 42 N-terminal domain-containing protein n=1 Tax=Natronomicrosphaera hydrolytica TaxID=3242702 RepID=A0ABV4U7F7_9BACT